MTKVLLVVNSGSSSVKFSVFTYKKKLPLLYHCEVRNIIESATFSVFDADHQEIFKQKNLAPGHESGFKIFFDWFKQNIKQMRLIGVGHRIVHGGKNFLYPVLVSDENLKIMASFNSLAPLHQPFNLQAIKIIKSLYPQLPQVACFDTSFHRTQDKLATLFAIPQKLTNEGIVRYGFHGLSYEYIASVLPRCIGKTGNKRVIVAHLGNGASLCAMYQRKSVATSMGFTALDGLMMGTRCGHIDPGVLLYLIQEKKLTSQELEHLLYKESGLLGVSGISSNVEELLINADVNAKEAIDLFCYRAALEIGSLATALKGFDALVFTAGIGEHAPLIREKICKQLLWLNLKINYKANNQNKTIISEDGNIIVAVIPTNEEYMIAKNTWNLMNKEGAVLLFKL